MNQLLLNDSDQSDVVIHKTVAHEMCHYAQHIILPYNKFYGYNKEKSHGYHWQRLMMMVGLDPNRYHTYNMSEIRKSKNPYEYACNCETHYISKKIHGNINRGRIYKCRTCKQPIKFVRLSNVQLPVVKIALQHPKVNIPVVNNRGAIRILGIDFSSKSAGALYLLKERQAGKNHYSKSEIASIVGMTVQTVHAVYKKNNINF